jgi:hypothetical protein
LLKGGELFSIIAFRDGASLGAIGDECVSPTTSNEGAIVLTTTANSTHPRMIGTANTRMAWAKNGPPTRPPEPGESTPV